MECEHLLLSVISRERFTWMYNFSEIFIFDIFVYLLIYILASEIRGSILWLHGVYDTECTVIFASLCSYYIYMCHICLTVRVYIYVCRMISAYCSPCLMLLRGKRISFKLQSFKCSSKFTAYLLHVICDLIG